MAKVLNGGIGELIVLSMSELSIDLVYQKATGFTPYDYQRRVAEEGLPELLQVPTGCGKTEAVGLGWLYRRRYHESIDVRTSTPHWLVIALPMRTLVEQTFDRFKSWFDLLAIDNEVALHLVRGGIGWRDHDWRLHPDRDSVFIGTVDMLLSRALNRGYADSRWNWPMSFGGFNNGVHWVFDEIQLMDVATPNTRQLQAFRDTFGTALPTASTWMSATVDERLLCTVDRPLVGSRIELGERDRASVLRQRLHAVRTVEEIELPEKRVERALAEVLVARHQPNSLTLAVLNTVDRAVSTWKALKQLSPAAEIVLLHSRYRSQDRKSHTKTALTPPNLEGKIVVSTQVLEAGIDVSSSILFTEAAPWPSIVQRAGRCNRFGESDSARLLWARPSRNPPYEDADIEAAIQTLRNLNGTLVTTTNLHEIGALTAPQITPIIRRRDLVDLFDTAPDLSGNDIDIARFIRSKSNRRVLVAWRQIEDWQPIGKSPQQHELCSVPMSEIVAWLKKPKTSAWRVDHLARRGDNCWVRCQLNDLRDGIEIVLDASKGGYESNVGWNKKYTKDVEVLLDVDSELTDTELKSVDDVAVGDDPASVGYGWYPLAAHLEDVEQEVALLLDALKPLDLTPEMKIAAKLAGLLHDIGKASKIWQDAALKTAEQENGDRIKTNGPYAKTGNRKRLKFERRFFRHELASALALMNEGVSLLENVQEADLVVYLVAAHHGRVRLSIRRPTEEPNANGELVTTLGVANEDTLPEINFDSLFVPQSSLAIPAGSNRYERRALDLRDRTDLGPFRLAFLEMIVRSADWRASKAVST